MEGIKNKVCEKARKYLTIGLALLFTSPAFSAVTSTYVLHEGNGFSIEVEPSVIVSRNGTSGPLTVSGGTWNGLIEAPDFLNEPFVIDQPTIGGTQNAIPGILAFTGINFSLLADVSGNVYDTQLFLWVTDRRGATLHEDFADFDFSGFTNLSAGLTLTSSAVPIPGALWLFSSALLTLIGRSRSSQRVSG